MMMFKQSNTVLSLFTLLPIMTVMSTNGPELFNKDQKMDKLILKNQIGYHFKKVVREVSQELFVSRKVDVSSLFLGVYVLEQTQKGLAKYCRGLSYVTLDSRTSGPDLPSFVHIKKPAFASFAEAKARCTAQNMQLPEVYSNLQKEKMSLFLLANNITLCFAGLQPDMIDATHRFISTGFPIWRTPHEKIDSITGAKYSITSVMDDFNAKFMYGNDERLYVRFDRPSIITNPKFKLGDHTYRDEVKDFPQVIAPIICEPKWDGTTYSHLKTDTYTVEDLKLDSRQKRSLPSSFPSDEDMDEFMGSRSLKEYCNSISLQAKDIQNEMSEKLNNLLSLVDISVQLENNNSVQKRERRSAFLAKFIFSTGIRLIWTLFGFMQKMRMGNKIKRLETAVSNTQRQVVENSNAIYNMSQIVYGNSIAIEQLKIATTSLDRRVYYLETKVEKMASTLDDVVNKLEASIQLSLIANLINRIQQSMNSGYDTLKDIIHCSLLGQTSPLLLPLDQIELVQNEVRKVSSGVLDTDFAKMQSIIVSDPKDPHLLLVVINVAALSRKEEELIKLFPIPYYENGKTFLPMLDYDTIVLDQLSRTYSILNEQEEYDCLFNRCYINDVERSAVQKTCGVPQLFDQQLEACVSEETLSNGVFLKPMLPDGIIFAFKGEVTTQLFCRDNSIIGPIKKLSGAGIMQLPNGCILSVTDDQGRNTKVKGQPLYRIIDAEDLTLVINGPLNAIQAQASINSTQKLMTYEGIITNHLSPVVKQILSVDSKLDNQATFIWSLVGILSVTGLIVLTIILVIFRSSAKFRLKIYDLRDRFAKLSQQISTLGQLREDTNRDNAPFVSPFSPRMRAMHFKAKPILRPTDSAPNDVSRAGSPSPYVSMLDVSSKMLDVPPKRNERTYVGFHPLNELAGITPGHPYPRLTPLLKQLSETRLDSESKEVERICNAKLSNP